MPVLDELFGLRLLFYPLEKDLLPFYPPRTLIKVFEPDMRTTMQSYPHSSRMRSACKQTANFFSLLLIFGTAVSVFGTQLYVDISNSNPHSPFTSWATAATNIQDAIDIATNGDEVVVNDGVYQVGARLVSGTGASNRVAVTKPLVVRSVNGPSATTILGYQFPSKKVGLTAVRCAYLTNGAVLTGFTLTGGGTHDYLTSIETPEQLSGGGVWCQSATAIVSNCVLSGNAAYWYGGGVYGGTLQNCTLSGNSVSEEGGGAAYSALTNCDLNANSATSVGGATYYCAMTNCTIENNSAYTGAGAGYGTAVACTFSGNNAGSSGGGAAYGTLIDCTLTGNTAHANGGGMNQATAIHCTFSGNSAVQSGGAAGSSTLSRCTLSNNSAKYGGGTYSSSLDNCLVTYNTTSFYGGGTDGGTVVNCTILYNSAVSSGGGAYGGTIQNSIIYYNTAPDGNCAPSSSLSYCCTTPIYGSPTGCIGADPQLDGNYQLQDGSPCLNAGNNSYVSSAVDLGGSARIVNSTVDLGAFELPTLATRAFRSWLQGYGLLGDGSEDYLDSDGDGMNNWQEYIAGTDPTDPTSVLQIVSGPSASSQDITWLSVPTRTYTIQRATDLRSFSALETNIPGQYGTTTFTDTDMTGSRQFFYRVLVEQ